MVCKNHFSQRFAAVRLRIGAPICGIIAGFYVSVSGGNSKHAGTLASLDISAVIADIYRLVRRALQVFAIFVQ